MSYHFLVITSQPSRAGRAERFITTSLIKTFANYLNSHSHSLHHKRLFYTSALLRLTKQQGRTNYQLRLLQLALSLYT